MIAKDLISDEIPPLKKTDSGAKALEWMQEFRVSHLPVVDKGILLGIVSDTDILDLNSPKDAIGKLKIPLLRPFVLEDHHAFEVLKLIATLDISIVPVVDESMKYDGVITFKNLMHAIAAMPFVNEPGAVLILEMNLIDYSLSQISQIIEGNGAKILSSYISSNVDSNNIEVTIKINKEDLTPIIQTFNRYNYTVKASFHQSEFTEDLKNRFDSFMNYINI